MMIVDCNGKQKEALRLMVITHEVRDAINKGAIPVQFVEAMIRGRNRPETWTEWYPLEEFRRKNPTIKV